MKPVAMQRVGGNDGDCLMAAAASILEIPLSELPVIPVEREREWFQIFSQAMQAVGFAVVERANEPPLAPNGYAIAIGPSPRHQSEFNHAVVALDGQVVYDPHPTRTGIEHISYWLMLVPLARTPARVSPSSVGEELAL